MKYKIEKRTYYNLNQVDSDYGIGTNERYYIKYQKWFLGIIPYWVYVMERNCMYRACVNYRINFRSIEKAEEFAKKYTCKGITPDTETYQTVKEFEC
jgi:hypothetical protein